MTEYRFPWGICNWCGMSKGDAYSSGHLVPSHLGVAFALLVETNQFPELVVIFPDFAIRTSLGTFSILLYLVIPIIYLGQCGVGSYFDISIGRCEICPIGYYQGSDNKNYCDECPMASSTTGPGAMDNTSCVLGKVASGVTYAGVLSIMEHNYDQRCDDKSYWLLQWPCDVGKCVQCIMYRFFLRITIVQRYAWHVELLKHWYENVLLIKGIYITFFIKILKIQILAHRVLYIYAFS